MLRVVEGTYVIPLQHAPYGLHPMAMLQKTTHSFTPLPPPPPPFQLLMGRTKEVSMQ